MASRKDKKGRALRKGESYSDSKGMYLYAYTNPFGKRRYIYAKDLPALREKEEQLKKDQLDGIDSYAAGKADLNFMFDRYMSTGISGTSLAGKRLEKSSIVIFCFLQSSYL